MDERYSAQNAAPLDLDQELLYFWAIGDLHFRDHKQWKKLHTPRMAQMFDDLQTVWREERRPAFCVFPGDLVERGAVRNYELAKKELTTYLSDMPFYPGIGNHEYLPEEDENAPHGIEEFISTWAVPIRYAWTAGKDESIVCIMLEQPDWFFSDKYELNMDVVFPPEALAFLDETLAAHAGRTAIVFAHCPLKNTVLDRDPARQLDDDSLTRFFFVENSPAVRDIFARHSNSALYICGHTHSGWGSPQLIHTETLGTHPLTHINLMSPWYTGFHGPVKSEDGQTLEYRSDDPDMLASFAVHVYPHKAIIRVRDHHTQQWLAQWDVPIV